MGNIEKKRSYEKEKYKTDPSGVRFNIEHLRIAMMRSKKKTKQGLVDFLLENYVKGENPVIERNYSNTPQQLAALPNYPIDQIIIKEPPKSVEQWVAEKREIEHPDLFEKFIDKLNRSNLTEKQKSLVRLA